MSSDHPPTEGSEWREALATYGPAVLVALFVNWALTAQFGLPPRRALLASIGVGIVLAIVLQRVVHGRAERP
ncbi:MAG: hypothetical protein ACYC2G_06630 [Gemmatimonadaceae bacterium]